MYGYRKMRERTLQVFETVSLEMPPVEYKTRGVWFDVPTGAKVQEATLLPLILYSPCERC